MAAVLAAIVLVVIDAAIANLALPTIAQALDVSPAASVWVVTGYQLSLVMFLLPAGAAGENFGYRRVFVAGVLIFTGASALCAFSTTLPWLLVARFLQGMGGAAVMSLAVALLRFVYPRHLLGAGIGWNALAVALSSAAGPTIGAVILSVASWPWLFAVNIPVGILVLAAATGLPGARGSKRGLDLTSIALNAAGFGTLIVGADLSANNLALGGGLVVLSLLFLAALIRRELPRATPLIPFDLLRAPSFRLSVVASIFCFSAQMASFVALPYYLQHGLRLDAFTTGLYITPWPLATALAAPISGRLADRMPTAWLCAAGGACLSLGLGLIALWPLGDSLAPLVAFAVLSGLGFGFFQTPNNRNMLLAAPRERSGAAGGMQGMARLVGQTAGAVLMTILFTLVPTALAPRLGLGIGAVLALCAGLVSLTRLAPRAVTRGTAS